MPDDRFVLDAQPDACPAPRTRGERGAARRARLIVGAGSGLVRRVAGLLLASAIVLGGSMPTPASALVFASPETEPPEQVPPDFPYWDHITQRRYEGPTVIYLGAGYALTARHVGMGEIAIGGTMYAPVSGSKRTLLNLNGTAADAMIFEIDRNAELPKLPFLPIAKEPVRPGEPVLVIGYGRGRDKVVEFVLEDGRTHFGFQWTRKGTKRWGTNRISSAFDILNQIDFTTRAVTFSFDEPLSPEATRYEAHAAVGDSGGPVFVERDGQWLLAAMMISVSGEARTPSTSTLYGDRTYAADLTYYRDEILRFTRPICANELDDDDDGRVDFPADPGCDTPDDRSEFDGDPLSDISLWTGALATFLAGCVIATFVGRNLSRPRDRNASAD